MVGGATYDGSALLAAFRWLEGLVQGPLAVTLAVLAVGATGLMMLSGRLPLRRGLVVTLGCFVLFGAPAIARGLFASATGIAGSGGPTSQSVDDLLTSAAKPQPAQPRGPNDPYAGASVSR